MSKIFSSDFHSASELYWVVDELKGMGSSFRIQLEFSNKGDIEKYQMKKFPGRNRKMSESDDSEEELPAAEGNDSVESDDDGSEVRSTCSKDTSFMKEPKKSQNSWVYQLDKPMMYFFGGVYEKEIKQLQKQFDCNIDIKNEFCTITGEGVNYKHIIARLRTLVENIHTQQMDHHTFAGIRDSALAIKKFDDKNIKICFETKGHYWAKKEDINFDDFRTAIDQIETTNRKPVSFWTLTKTLARTKKFLWLHDTITKAIGKQVKKLEKVYEVQIEECERVRGYIVHAETKNLADSIQKEIFQLLDKLFIFSITVNYKPYQREELQNYMRRYCKRVEARWGNRRLCFCLFSRDLAKNLPHIFRFLLNSNISYQPLTQLHLHASHYRNSKVAQRFVSMCKTDNFRNVQITEDNITVSQPFEDVDICAKFIGVIEAYSRFIQDDLSYVLADQSESPLTANDSVMTGKLDTSSLNEVSMSMQDVTDYISTEVQMKKKVVYSLSYPLKASEVFEGESIMVPGKKDAEITDFLQNEIDKSLNCKGLLFNNRVALPKLLEKTLLYFTDWEVMGADGELPDRITLYEISKKSNRPMKYLVQAVPDQLVRNEDGGWTATKGYYIPTHSVTEF